MIRECTFEEVSHIFQMPTDSFVIIITLKALYDRTYTNIMSIISSLH